MHRTSHTAHLLYVASQLRKLTTKMFHAKVLKGAFKTNASSTLAPRIQWHGEGRNDDRHPDILQLKSPKSPSAIALEQGRPLGLHKSVKQERNCHQQKEHVPFGGEGGLGPRSEPDLAGLEMETEILQGLYWGLVARKHWAGAA